MAFSDRCEIAERTPTQRRQNVTEVARRARHDHDLSMRDLARPIKAMRLRPRFRQRKRNFRDVRGDARRDKERLVARNGSQRKGVYRSSARRGSGPKQVGNMSRSVKKELIIIRSGLRLDDLEADARTLRLHPDRRCRKPHGAR